MTSKWIKEGEDLYDSFIEAGYDNEAALALLCLQVSQESVRDMEKIVIDLIVERAIVANDE
jgi:hypothetical protein